MRYDFFRWLCWGVLLVWTLILATGFWRYLPQVGSTATTKPQPRLVEKTTVTYQQLCDMCGRQWEVELLNSDDPPPPPTIAWCFFDGVYCDRGFKLLQQQLQHPEDLSFTRKLHRHCLLCQPCRCAVFNPEEWETCRPEILRQIDE